MLKPSAEERLLAEDYDDIILFCDYSYDDALIGVTHDNRAVYDYEMMVIWLMEEEGWSEEDAVAWVEYNAIGSLQCAGAYGPIVMYPLRRITE